MVPYYSIRIDRHHHITEISTQNTLFIRILYFPFLDTWRTIHAKPTNTSVKHRTGSAANMQSYTSRPLENRAKPKQRRLPIACFLFLTKQMKGLTCPLSSHNHSIRNTGVLVIQESNDNLCRNKKSNPDPRQTSQQSDDLFSFATWCANDYCNERCPAISSPYS